MAWTASLGVSVGDATKETDYDQLVANAEYLHTALNTIMDTDVGGALSISVLNPESLVAWDDSVETGTDENAQRVIFVDLDDPLQLWDYTVFMQQIQDTSWHDELGDPPVHGLMWITEDQNNIVWWNRETAAIYMQFDAGATNMIKDATPTMGGLAFLDGIIYGAGSTGPGVLLFDLVGDSAYEHTVNAYKKYAGDISERNSGNDYVTMHSLTSGEIVSSAANDIAAVRDPVLTDEFGRPKHWWSAETAGGPSIYNPVDDAIYDGNVATAMLGGAISASGVMAHPTTSGSDLLYWMRSIFGIAADSWGHAPSNAIYTGGTDAEDLAWSGSEVMGRPAILDGRSWASEGMAQIWLPSDEGLYVVHAHASDQGGQGALIRLHEDYASPMMWGNCRGCWPLHAVTDVSAVAASDLTNNNSVAFSSGGPAGSYATFASAEHLSHADAGNNFDLFAEDCTVSAWFRGTGTAQDIIMGKGGGGAYHWLLQHSSPSSGILSFQVNDPTGTAYLNAASTDINCNDGNWHYATAVYVLSTNDLTLYMDGEKVAFDDTPSGSKSTGSAKDFTIGALDTTAQYDGDIGGISISKDFAATQAQHRAEYARGLRRINSGVDTNDTISDNDIAAIAADPHGKYVAVMGDDKVVRTFNEFAVPIATDTYPGTTARDVAIKSMPRGPDPHLIMAGSDQIEIVQPDVRGF